MSDRRTEKGSRLTMAEQARHAGVAEFFSNDLCSAETRQQIAIARFVAVLAINQLDRRRWRACASGVEVRVTTTHDVMATVIRTALAETARHRPTDRPIRVTLT